MMIQTYLRRFPFLQEQRVGTVGHFFSLYLLPPLYWKKGRPFQLHNIVLIPLSLSLSLGSLCDLVCLCVCFYVCSPIMIPAYRHSVSSVMPLDLNEDQNHEFFSPTHHPSSSFSSLSSYPILFNPPNQDQEARSYYWEPTKQYLPSHEEEVTHN